MATSEENADWIIDILVKMGTDNRGRTNVSGDQIRRDTLLSADDINSAVELLVSRGDTTVTTAQGTEPYSFNRVSPTIKARAAYYDTIKGHAEQIIGLLSEAEDYSMRPTDLARVTRLRPIELNWAVEYLSFHGRVIVQWDGGPDAFEFAGVSLKGDAAPFGAGISRTVGGFPREQQSTDASVRTAETTVGRPIAAFELVEAKEHIDAARSAVQSYLYREPDPDDFSLAVLEALLREVDRLGDQLDSIVATHTVPPAVDESLSAIDWIHRALMVKQGLDELKNVLELLLAYFGF